MFKFAFAILISMHLSLVHANNLITQIQPPQPANNPKQTTSTRATPVQATKHDTWSSKAEEVLMHAMSLMDTQYKYGGNNPETGFDCSGFVRYVFNQAADIHLPRTANAISSHGQSITKQNLQPGDLVFFNTVRSKISHVGIYLGSNQFIHAPRTGTVVRIDNMNKRYWASRFRAAKRLDTEL